MSKLPIITVGGKWEKSNPAEGVSFKKYYLSSIKIRLRSCKSQDSIYKNIKIHKNTVRHITNCNLVKGAKDGDEYIGHRQVQQEVVGHRFQTCTNAPIKLTVDEKINTVHIRFHYLTLLDKNMRGCKECFEILRSCQFNIGGSLIVIISLLTT